MLQLRLLVPPKADSIASKALKWDSAKAAKASRDDSIKFQKQFNLANNSFGAQVSSFKESQKEFERTNLPFLQAINAKIMNLNVGENITGEFELTNLTNEPVKIISQKQACTIRVSRFAIGSVKWTNDEDAVNSYVIKETPLEIKFTVPIKLSQYQHDNLINGNLSLYMVRKIKYQNLVSGKPRYYIFELQMKPVYGNTSVQNNTYSVFHFNENQN